MMKNKMYAGALLCALAMMAGCSNEEAVTGNAQPQGFSLKAEMGTARTRTTVASDYKVNWSTGDKIYVYGTNNVYSSLTLQSGDGTTTGTFTGTLKGDGDETDLQYALYPVPTVSGTNMTINLPATYNYGDPSNSPMFAVFETADKTQLTFKHLCGMIRLQIKGIPSDGVKTLTLAATDQNIAGDAAVTETNGAFSLAAPEAEGKSISISIPDGTPAADATEALVFDIPLPVGTYTNGLALGISDAGGNSIVAEKTIKNVEIVAGEIMVMSQLKVIDLSITGSTSEFVEAKHVATADDLSNAISEGEPYITLMEDVTLTTALSGFTTEKPTEVDLNGKTLTLSSQDTHNILSGNDVTFENGRIAGGEQADANANVSLFAVSEGGAVTLDNVTLDAPKRGTAFYPAGNAASVTIKNSTVKAMYMCVGTNAGKVDNYNVVITLENSKFCAETAVLVNIPCQISIDDCELTGGLQGLVVRGGSATCANTTITKDAQYTTDSNIYETWGQGNMVRAAAITLGNKDNEKSYQYPTSLTLTNCTVSVAGNNTDTAPAVYAYANQTEGMGVTFTYDDSCTFTPSTLTYASSNITVNGVAQNTGAD